MTLSGSSSSSSAPSRSSSVENDTASERIVSHGSISIAGRRRDKDDTMTSVLKTVTAPGDLSGYDFFAVYGGARVSEMYRDGMHLLLADEVRASGCGGNFDWEKVMCSCFEKMDAEVSGGAVVKDGATAVVVVVGKDQITVGNFGYSRAVLCRGGVAIPLSTHLKHDRSDDMDRVKAAGTNTINHNVVGAHANSRSIGDQLMAQCVISQPKVTINKRTDSDQFIIVASDGLWGVLSSDIACDVVRKCLAGNFSQRFFEEKKGSCSSEAAMMLAELAIARGSKDNITVIVVELNKLDV